MSETRKFRDEDTGKVEDVPFEIAITAAGDFLTHPDGRTLIRVRKHKVEKAKVTKSHPSVPLPSYFSDAFPVVPPGTEQAVKEDLARQGVYTDIDSQGRLQVTSAQQHGKLATALGMKTGRDGYGHTDDDGTFQTSGRRLHGESQEGKSRVSMARAELESMSDDVPEGAVEQVMAKHGLGDLL
jgi:hypothetical protein